MNRASAFYVCQIGLDYAGEEQVLAVTIDIGLIVVGNSEAIFKKFPLNSKVSQCCHRLVVANQC